MPAPAAQQPPASAAASPAGAGARDPATDATAESGAPLVLTRNLTKRFKLYRSPSHRLFEWLTLNRVQKHDDFYALADVCFDVRRGECLGIIGTNGSGKSTLLKILTGTMDATAGTHEVNGRVLALLELGTGFNRELTGAENIHLSSRLLGLDPAYVGQQYDKIVEFAGLGDFLHRPVKFYSSGMAVRLAFSLFAFLDPDVLIVDEALSVGDAAFQRKCYRRIEEMLGGEKRAVILVTHDTSAVISFCDRVLWLDRGKARMLGEPKEVVTAYVKHVFGADNPPPGSPRSQGPVAAADTPTDLGLPPASFHLKRAESAVVYPSTGATLTAVWLEDHGGRPVAVPSIDKPFRLCYHVRFDTGAEHPVFGMRVTTVRGEVVFGTNSQMMGVVTPDRQPGQGQTVRWPIAAGMAAGEYFISCGCSRADDPHAFYLREVDAYRLSVLGKNRTVGLCALVGEPEIDPDGP